MVIKIIEIIILTDINLNMFGYFSLVAKKKLGTIPWSLKNALDRIDCDETGE
jgi:hypothetical protein